MNQSATAALTEKQIMDKLRVIDERMSPENLSCDGELSQGEQAAKYRELARELKGLLKLLGRTPTYAELYPGTFMASPRLVEFGS